MCYMQALQRDREERIIMTSHDPLICAVGRRIQGKWERERWFCLLLSLLSNILYQCVSEHRKEKDDNRVGGTDAKIERFNVKMIHVSIETCIKIMKT
jgi:hypothetical protein